MNKVEIAKTAFWGGNDLLMDYINVENGYTENGIHYPSNGFTLAEVIDIVENMDEDVLEMLF